MNYQRVAAALVALALLAGCASEAPAPVVRVATAVVNTATPAVAEITYRVERGEVAELLRLNGRVAAAVDEDVAFTRDGYVQALHVQRGAAVTRGQLLAELDPGEVPSQLAQARADLAALQRTVASAQQRQRFAVAAAQIGLGTASDNLALARRPTSAADLADAQDEIERARLELDRTRNGTSVAKTQAAAAVQHAANNLRDRQAAYSQVMWANGNQPLDDLGDGERARQEQAQRAVADSEAQLRLAEVSYDLAVQNEISAVRLAEQQIATAERKSAELRVGPDPLEVRLAERAVASAQLSLSQARALQSDPELAARQEQAQRAISELEEQIAADRIYAPFDGVVAELGVKTGDRVEVYAPAINIVDPARMLLVVTDIASDDLARLSTGQAVTILFGRYPQQEIPGSIEQLPADQTSAGSQVRGNPFLRVAFDQSKLQLDIGDSADITISFGREPNALWLPPSAVRHFDQQAFVVRKEDGQQRRVDVTTGIVTAERVQIVAGLREGDVVVGASARAQ